MHVISRPIGVLQSSVYKGPEMWQKSVEDLFAINSNGVFSKKDICILKAKEAVSKKLPTVVTALIKTLKTLEDTTISGDLKKDDVLFKNPPKIVLKELFEKTGDLPSFNELGEEYFYYRTIYPNNDDYIIEETRKKLAFDNAPKFSDYLGLHIMLSNKDLYTSAANEIADAFAMKFLVTDLGEYNRLVKKGDIEFDRERVLNLFEFLEEGVKKWAFLDIYCSKRKLDPNKKESDYNTYRYYFRTILCRKGVTSREILSKKTDTEIKKDLGYLVVHMNDLIQSSMVHEFKI